MNLEPGAGPTAVASKFNGGEERRETGGNLAYVALAAAAPGATSVKVCLLWRYSFFMIIVCYTNQRIEKIQIKFYLFDVDICT